jgi:hypothetical protein
MKGKYKNVSVWCPSCDKDFVAIGTKCKECGTRVVGSKIKQPTSNQILKELVIINDILSGTKHMDGKALELLDKALKKTCIKTPTLKDRL